MQNSEDAKTSKYLIFMMLKLEREIIFPAHVLTYARMHTHIYAN